MMKVAYDHQAFVLQKFGGISRYFTKLVVNSTEDLVSSRVFAPRHQNQYLKDLPREMVVGDYTPSFLPKSWRIYDIYNHVASRKAIASWRPDIIHETYYSQITTRKNKYPVVLTVFDMIHEIFADQISRFDRTKKLKRAAVDRADHVICISENTKRDLIDLYGISDDKISVIHLGFDAFPQRAQDEMFFDQHNPYILYVGLREGYKNFMRMIEAVASSTSMCKDFNVVAFGGPPFSRTELARFYSLGFSEGQIKHVVGSDDLLASFYKKASLFVYPSLYEGFGIPPLEAMGQCCPVACSDTSSIPEIVSFAGEYFDPNDIGDIRSALERVLYSQDRALELIELGKRRLRDFSWERCRNETFSIYRKLDFKG